MTLVRSAKLIFVVLVLLAGFGRNAMTQEQKLPNLIRIIVPFAPGGPNDFIGRLLADEMSKTLGSTFVVENRPGANTQIGTEIVARAKPDGSVIMLNSLAVALLPLTNKDISVDVKKDLTPISEVAEGPQILFISSKLPIKTFREFIAYAKANPGKLKFAPSSSADLLAGEMFRKAAGIEVVTVKYSGVAQAIQAVVANEVDYLTAAPGIASAQVEAGTLRALAVTASKRYAGFPDLPSMPEVGLPNYTFVPWVALFAPPGTPMPIIELMNKAANEALKLPRVVEGIQRLGYIPVGSSIDGFAKFYGSETERWKQGAEEAGVKF